MYTVTVITAPLSYSIDIAELQEACAVFKRETSSIFAGAVFLVDYIRSVMLEKYVL